MTQDYPGGKALLERARSVLEPLAVTARENMGMLNRWHMGSKVEDMLSGHPQGRLSVDVLPAHILQRMALLSRDQLRDLDIRSDKIARQAAFYQMWARQRAVYAPHPELLGALSASSVERGLPVAVLDRMPHPDPFLLLPPMPMPRAVARAVRECPTLDLPLAGVFVTGKFDGESRMCSTADPRRDSLCLNFLLTRGGFAGPDAPVPGGASEETQEIRTTVPLGTGTFSVDRAVERTLERFHYGEVGGAAPESAEAFKVWMPWAVRQALLALLYICTDRPDIEPYRRPAAQTKAKAKRAPKAPRQEVGEVQQVGFRLGPALGAAREKAVRQASAATGGGGQLPPHWRGPSPSALYWTGPGRSVPVFRPRADYWVHRELLGEQEKPVTVYPVR